ncbi:hypothetical protein K0M31_000438 [Melipona bicolor]|uniref:Uncharacterized protein n=1 Tax=Melipona bicolor TaxID=60889 RepID=A0AA40GDI5_9HYME|nr:hypothetical protein K0M31_000438 [Melipona bicolor]
MARVCGLTNARIRGESGLVRVGGKSWAFRGARSEAKPKETETERRVPARKMFSGPPPD